MMFILDKNNKWQSISASQAAEISSSWIMQISDNNIYLMTTYEPYLATSHDWVEEGAMEVNPTGIFMFKTKERCESFNKKLLELAERQAQIEYGEVEWPGIYSGMVRIDSSRNQIVIVNSDGLQRTFIPDIKKFRDYCNQCLDYIEQQELRA